MSQENRYSDQYQGLLFIGDPHVESRQPGFRKDNYPEVILEKIRWCLDYAHQEKLLPVFLGDLFDKPRGNPNWLIGRLIEILAKVPSIGIYGNHDCAETRLTENDSLSILLAANSMRLVSHQRPFRFCAGDREVIVGGSSYRAPIPQSFQPRRRQPQGLFDLDPLVFWITHHDIGVPGYDNARIDPHQIDGVDVLVNGHIHRRLDDVRAGRTVWMNPGNIARRSRSEASQQHVPAVMRIDVLPEDYDVSFVEVPHAPFDDVFHEAIIEQVAGEVSSDFVSGLAELTTRKTASGAGLHRFLDENMGQFDTDVADVIRELACEVTNSMENGNG